MSASRRRLDRIEARYRRFDPQAPFQQNMAAIWLAMTPADRATHDYLAVKYAAPADSPSDPGMDPDDYAAFVGIMARGLRALGLVIPEKRERETEAEYRAEYARWQQDFP
ncbi:MAG TPA: hypothetical protein VGR08_07630 [Thermomicrobiales bacterium]|nr:hypothetical protein [Thermomicrobiales bacterium]